MKYRAVFIALAMQAIVCHAAPAAGGNVARLDLGSGIPMVQVRINGQGPFTLVVDTGTNCDAILSPRVVKRLGLEASGRSRITDLGGGKTHSIDMVNIDSLTLAGEEFHNIRAAEANLPDGDSVLDGILGFGFFRNLVFTLDYPHRRLVLNNSSLADPSDAKTVPMRLASGTPMIEIAIAGEKLYAGIDSGAMGVSVPVAVADRLQFESGRETVAFGRTQVSDFALRGAVLHGAVEVAGFQFDQPWLEINPVFHFANIGSDLMREFSVTFDQHNRRVRFDAEGKLHRLKKPRNWGQAEELEEMVGTVVITQTY